MIRQLAALGRTGLAFSARLGRANLLMLAMLNGVPAMLRRPRLLLEQMLSVGVLTVLIIAVSGVFVGMVLGLQGYYILSRFAADAMLGVLVATSLVRELGPVVTALLFAGRAGSALTAEIGLMKATDQLSAMEMMAVDPMKYVATPRFLGGVIAMPLLTAIFSMVGLLGAHLVAVEQLGVDVGSYWQQLQNIMDKEDVYEGITKSVVFGFVASLVAVWEGYNSTPTAEGVGRATTRTVVVTSIAVLFFNYMITAMYL